MRVPLSWLADYVDIDLPVVDLAQRLTMFGLKVEGIDRPGEQWKDVVVGQVISLEPHPASTKPLWVARVDLGGDQITVVTGAPNLEVGQKVPAVRVGGLIPHGPDGQPMIIRAKPMAGIQSEGMLCSQRELGVSEEHSGIWILPPDSAVGRPLAAIMGDEVLDIETNPNRPDTLSIIGIAREVAAMTRQQVSVGPLDPRDGTVEYLDAPSIPVEVEDFHLCPRYTALRIDGVGGGTTPAWMASRLEAAGMRPINLLVDITNYVMLEYGQPMHAFDARMIRGGRIVVRPGCGSEHIRTLDGVDRVLTPNDLVIADVEGPIAIAGVMGGENSEIASDTSAIVLESATFDPVSVRRTAKSLNLRTESSSRFEKGLPPELTVPGARRYLQLLSQILDNPIRAARISDVSAPLPGPRIVAMPMRDLHRLTGVRIPVEDASESLSLLGFGVNVIDTTLRVEVPYWRRVDIALSADVVEEVTRSYGFDRVPSTLPRRTMAPPPPVAEMHWEGLIGERLLSVGTSEAVTHSLTSPESMGRLVRASEPRDYESEEFWATLVPNPAGVYAHQAETCPIRIANPATRDRRVVRISLIPSLLDVVARNLKHTDEGVAFFEIARAIFPRPAELAYERRTLGLALAGNSAERTWATSSPGPYTFYDLKGMIEAVLDTLGVSDWNAEARRHPALHPGRSAVLRIGGHDVAYLGELHPGIASQFDIDNTRVQVAEIDLDTLFEHASRDRTFHPLPRFPAVYRDIAVVVDDDVPAAEIMRVIKGTGHEMLEAARLFDVYTGDPLPKGKKSTAIGLTFRAPGATLTQDDVDVLMSRIVAALDRELHAAIRE